MKSKEPVALPSSPAPTDLLGKFDALLSGGDTDIDVFRFKLAILVQKLAESVPSTPSPEKCGLPAAAIIPRWGMSFACVLPMGHKGKCQPGGNCIEHGDYVGQRCPKWPDCVSDICGGVPSTPVETSTYTDHETGTVFHDSWPKAQTATPVETASPHFYDEWGKSNQRGNYADYLESQLTQVRAELEPLLKRLMATTIQGALLQLDDHFAGDARLVDNLRNHVAELIRLRSELEQANNKLKLFDSQFKGWLEMVKAGETFDGIKAELGKAQEKVSRQRTDLARCYQEIASLKSHLAFHHGAQEEIKRLTHILQSKK